MVFKVGRTCLQPPSQCRAGWVLFFRLAMGQAGPGQKMSPCRPLTDTVLLHYVYYIITFETPIKVSAILS